MKKVSATAGQAADGVRRLADRFGIEPGMVVMEMGYDDDVDEDLRDALIDRCGELVDEDTDEVVDVVLLWWRDGDGDLVDTLVDAIAPLADNGAVWLLTPKAGRPGHVEPSEITESAPTAGLQQTSIIRAGRDGYEFPLLSDFWPHGAVAQAYGVFNFDRGFADRGTFLIDRDGVVRFAELNSPGEARDQNGWRKALAAL